MDADDVRVKNALSHLRQAIALLSEVEYTHASEEVREDVSLARMDAHVAAAFCASVLEMRGVEA